MSGEQPPRVVLHDAHVDVVWVAKQNGIARDPDRTVHRWWDDLLASADDQSDGRDWRSRMGIGRDRRRRVAARGVAGWQGGWRGRGSRRAGRGRRGQERASGRGTRGTRGQARHQAAEHAEHADKKSHQAADHAVHMNHAHSGSAPRQDIFHARLDRHRAAARDASRDQRLFLLQDRDRHERCRCLRRLAASVRRRCSRHCRRAFVGRRADLWPTGSRERRQLENRCVSGRWTGDGDRRRRHSSHRLADADP